MSHQKMIKRLMSRAVRHFNEGNTEDCKRYAEGALRFTQRTGQDPHPQAIAARTLLAMVAMQTDRLSAAEAHCETAIQEAQALYSAHHVETIRGLQLKAHVLKADDRLEDALGILEDALSRCALADGTHPLEAELRSNLGAFYRFSGRLDRSWQHHEAALVLTRAAHGEGSLPVAGVLQELGTTARLLGRIEEARRLSDEAGMILVSALPPDHPDIAENLNHRGMVAIDERDHDLALSLFSRAVEIVRQQPEPSASLLSALLNNIALVHEQHGDAAKADALYEQSMQADADAPRSAVTMSNRAALALHTGQVEEAVTLQREAVARMRALYDRHHPDFLTLLSNLSIYYAISGDIDAMLANHQEVIALCLEQTHTLLRLGSQDQKQAYIRTVSRQAHLATALHLQLAPERADVARMAFEATLQLKGRALDVHAALIEKLRLSGDGEPALLKALSEAHAVYAARVFSGESDPMILQEHRQTLEELESRLSAGSSGHLESLWCTPTLQQVADRLPDNGVLIEWVTVPHLSPETHRFEGERYGAYILDRQGNLSWQDLGETEPVDELIVNLLVHLSSDGQLEGMVWKMSANILYNRLFEPLRSHIPDGAHLLLCPDGLLNLIPFEVLLSGAQEFLIQQHLITYLTCGRDLLFLDAQGPAATSPPVIISAPDYNLSTADGEGPRLSAARQRPARLEKVFWRPLSGALEEGRKLAGLLPDAVLLEDAEATESALREIQRPTFLHLATHGFFFHEEMFEPVDGEPEAAATVPPMLRSGLVLARANAAADGEDDGYMTAAEMSMLDLTGTKLVVLSACKAGVGEIRTGEVVHGLRRALMLAGAQSQITSLWRVMDAATVTLMERFYTNLLGGLGRSESLRAAQLSFLAEPQLAHPRNWGPFISLGDWRPV